MVKHNITFGNTATIIPFAQSEMVSTFMEGIDPKYKRVIIIWLSKLFNELPGKILESIDELSADRKQKLIHKLRESATIVLKDVRNKLEEYEEETYINKVITAVAVLPKEELGAMAESLVNLTSLKRRVSIDNEMVGGPIDVAVISRGDGFIWIKRKHYFKPECNHQFFENYYHHQERGTLNEEPAEQQEGR